MRNVSSPNPEALPQRSNLDCKDDDSESRVTNGRMYAEQKDDFVQSELRLGADSEYAGLYFFFDRNNKNNPFFYIGKADNLYQRITKHFLTFDYLFYASAFPHNCDRYYSECMKFYAEGKYAKNGTIYERQFNAFKVTPFKEIGWICATDFNNAALLRIVESSTISFYKPLANGTKGSMKRNQISAKIFEDVRISVSRWLTGD
ncbi:MAG: GIY-YIG nuclease family protein [Bacteroidota bacterium]